MCFLEREVYAFLSTFDKRGERVRGAMLRARIFCLWEGRRWTGRRWVAGGTCGLAGRATQEERRVRAVRKREESCFLLFLEERSGPFACSPGGSRGRGRSYRGLGV